MSTAPRHDLLVVGASAGGVLAVKRLIEALGGSYGKPVALVIHIAEHRRSHLARVLSGALPAREAADKEELVPGTILVAPPGYHLLIGDHTSCALSTEAPVHYCRPAIDLLFETAADVFGDRVAGLLLTGANADGAAGLAAIEARGGAVGVQDPRTAEATAMPVAGIAACVAPRVGTIEELAGWLVGAPG